MWTEKNVSVKYTKATCNVLNYDTGLTDWEGLDLIYKDAILRNKVVCKLDVALMLNRYLTVDTIKTYRPVLMMIAKGTLKDPNQFSGVVNNLISIDEVFHKAIRDIFNSCPEDRSLGDYIIEVFADVFKNAENTYRSFFRGKPEVVICVSNGYLYFSIEDINNKPTLIEELDCEVLSYAKNWKGEFQYIK